MVREVGAHVFRVSEPPPDRAGVRWVIIQRRQVLARDDALTRLSSADLLELPCSSTPDRIEAAAWFPQADGFMVMENQIADGSIWLAAVEVMARMPAPLACQTLAVKLGLSDQAASEWCSVPDLATPAATASPLCAVTGSPVEQCSPRGAPEAGPATALPRARRVLNYT